MEDDGVSRRVVVARNTRGAFQRPNDRDHGFCWRALFLSAILNSCLIKAANSGLWSIVRTHPLPTIATYQTLVLAVQPRTHKFGQKRFMDNFLIRQGCIRIIS